MMRMQTSGTATCKQAAEAFASDVEEGGELFGCGKWCEYGKRCEGSRGEEQMSNHLAQHSSITSANHTVPTHSLSVIRYNDTMSAGSRFLSNIVVIGM